MNPENMRKILAAGEPASPPTGLAETIEGHLDAMTRTGIPARGRIRLLPSLRVAGGIAAAIVVSTGIWILSNLTYRNPPPQHRVRINIKISSVSFGVDEIRRGLSRIIQNSDLIVTGQVVPGANSREFALNPIAVLKGNLNSSATFTLRTRPEGICGRDPATFNNDAWVILFVTEGIVYSDQYKAEFGSFDRLLAFTDKVRRYLDGTIVPDLIREFENGGTTGLPFGELDRIREDITELKPDYDFRNAVPALISFVRENPHSPEAGNTLWELCDLNDPRTSDLFWNCLNDGGYPAVIRMKIAESLGILNDERIIPFISDRTKPMRVRIGAVRGAWNSKMKAAVDTLLTVIQTEPDHAKGPLAKGEIDKGYLPVEGYDLVSAAIHALGYIGDSRAVPILIWLLQPGNRNVPNDESTPDTTPCDYSWIAAGALADIEDPSAIPALEAANANATNDSLRRHFQEALAKLRKHGGRLPVSPDNLESR